MTCFMRCLHGHRKRGEKVQSLQSSVIFTLSKMLRSYDWSGKLPYHYNCKSSRFVYKDLLYFTVSLVLMYKCLAHIDKRNELSDCCLTDRLGGESKWSGLPVFCSCVSIQTFRPCIVFHICWMWQYDLLRKLWLWMDEWMIGWTGANVVTDVFIRETEGRE